MSEIFCGLLIYRSHISGAVIIVSFNVMAVSVWNGRMLAYQRRRNWMKKVCPKCPCVQTRYMSIFLPIGRFVLNVLAHKLNICQPFYYKYRLAYFCSYFNRFPIFFECAYISKKHWNHNTIDFPLKLYHTISTTNIVFIIIYKLLFYYCYYHDTMCHYMSIYINLCNNYYFQV